MTIHEELYERDGGITVPLRFFAVEDSRRLENWLSRIRRTLDLLPAKQLELFQTNGSGSIEFKPIDGYSGGAFGFSGQRFRGGTSTSNWVRVSHGAMGEAQNARIIYTFLHEFGHLIDHWEDATGRPNPTTCMSRLKVDAPLECLAILRSYHGGRTRSPSEHFSDVYGFYFANEVGGERRRVHRGGRAWRCIGQCARWDAQLTRSTRAAGLELPSPYSAQMMALRYGGLFRTEPFAGVARQGLADSSAPPRSAPVTAPRRGPRGGQPSRGVAGSVVDDGPHRGAP